MKTSTQRIFYIDNLRIVLTFLVVAHHWAIANGAPGDWYLTEGGLSTIEGIIMSLFVATNQAFFMGFFFFISAYFVPSSFNRKGGAIFVKQRLIRLGIPLIFYIFVISPLLIYSVRKFTNTEVGGLVEFLAKGEGFSPGPMWFVALLLIFSLIYWVFRQLFKTSNRAVFLKSINKSWWIIGFISLILITFFIRIYSPVGDWIPFLGLQPAHLLQYIICFTLGIWAYEFNILDSVSFRSSRKWIAISQLLIFVVFPAMFIIAGPKMNVDLFMGGKTWESFSYVLWEQSVAVSMILALLGVFKKYMTKQSGFTQELSKNSYAIYVFHGIVLVSVSMLFQPFDGHSIQKFVLLMVPVFLFCYLLAKLVKAIPMVNKVL